MDDIKIEFIKGIEGFEKAKALRYKVFVQEQNVPVELEWDDMDKIATHLILYHNGETIGTARIFRKEGKTFVGRVAVLKEFRGKGLGKLIMQEILEFARNKGVKRIFLHSQTYIKGFYEKLGFKEVGEEFMEAGIPHIEMFIDL